MAVIDFDWQGPTTRAMAVEGQKARQIAAEDRAEDRQIRGEERAFAQEEQRANRELSPLEQSAGKYIQLVLSGQMDPQEAAVRARYESNVDGFQDQEFEAPSPMSADADAPWKMPVSKQAAMTQSETLNQGLSIGRAAENPYAGMQSAQPQGLGAMPDPRTARDLNTLMQLDSFIRANKQTRMSMQDQAELIRLREEERRKTLGVKQDWQGAQNDTNRSFKAAEVNAKLDMEKTKLDQTYKLTLMKIRAMLSVADSKSGSAKDIAAMKANVNMQISNLRSAAAVMQSTAYIAQDAQAVQSASQMLQEADRLAMEIEQISLPMMRGGSTEPNTQSRATVSGPAYAPQGPPQYQGPTGEAPPLNVEQPVKLNPADVSKMFGK